MEQKIDLEIRLRELASQSMLEARNEIDVLEVEKSLLTSDQRMNCYASQLEQQRKQLSNPSLSTDSGRASKTSSQQQRRDASQPRSTGPADRSGAGGQQVSDVIGAPLLAANGSRPAEADSGAVQRCDNSYASEGTGSPSFSSQSSPSKLSPVSGESANSAVAAATTKQGQSSSSAASSCHRSRRSNNAVRQQSSGANTLNNRRQRLNSGGGGDCVGAKKSKQRERLKQSITRQSNIDCKMVVENGATLTISELRIPLMWRDVDHFKGRGDYRRYAVFCLLKIDSQIYDTQLISDVDRQMTDLTFDDIIVFNNVDHEYELTLEVYSCVYLEQFSFSSTPRKLKEKLSNSVSRAMGRRLATQTASANYTKELEAYDKSYRFAMIASAKLGLMDASESIKTYDLHLVSPEAHGRQVTLSRQQHPSSSDTMAANNSSTLYYNSNLSGAGYCGIVTASNHKDIHKNTLPLFGHFCCRLQVRPDVFDKSVKSGYLRIAPINLLNPVVSQQHTSEDLSSSACRENNQRIKSSQTKGRTDSPTDDSGKSSLSNDDLNTSSNDCSMLRSALAASSKLATISMSNSTVHWALLRNFTLLLWHIDEHKLEMALRRGHAPQVDISSKQPFCINIDRNTRLLRVSNSSLTIETDKGCFVIALHNLNEQMSANSHDEIGQWLRPIEQMIYDSHIWSTVLNHHLPSLRAKHPKQ